MINNNAKNKTKKSQIKTQPSMFSNDYQVDDSKHNKNISKYDTTYKNNIENTSNSELLLECKDPNAPTC